MIPILLEAVISFHANSPAIESNLLSELKVAPLNNVNYLLKEPLMPVWDEIAVPVNVKPGPSVSFAPADSFSLCKDEQIDIQLTATGGLGNYQYNWSNGSQVNTIGVKSAILPGPMMFITLQLLMILDVYSRFRPSDHHDKH